MATSITRKNETMYAIAYYVNEDAEEPDYDDPEVLEALWEDENYEPEGWPEYAKEMWPDGPREGENWPNGYKPFFWPSNKRLYTTRKAAEGRRDLINRWGGSAIVVVADVEWVPLDVMDTRRNRDRLLRQLADTKAELRKLGGQLEE